MPANTAFTSGLVSFSVVCNVDGVIVGVIVGVGVGVGEGVGVGVGFVIDAGNATGGAKPAFATC